MPARITHDVVATIGKYNDRQTGEEKKRYTNVGKCFTDDQGRQSIKLDSIPVGPEWSGWLSLYPIQDKLPNGRPQQRSMPPAPKNELPNDDDDDHIPF